MSEEKQEGIGMQAPLSIEQYVGIALSAAKDNESDIFFLQEKVKTLEERMRRAEDSIFHFIIRDKKLELERKLWKKKHKKHHK